MQLIEFARLHRLPLAPGPLLDSALERLANATFFEGGSVSEFRYVAWGYAHVHDLVLSRCAYPRLFASLRGWQAAAPAAQRSPLPWELVLLLCDVWLRCADPCLRARAHAAAAALPLQWDGYLRPSEVLGLTPADLIAPRRPRDPWAVVVRPAPAGPDSDILFGRKPAKTGEFDGTVMVGDKVSDEQGRGWLRALLRRLAASSSRSAPLFALSLPQYEMLFRWGLSQLDLEALRLSPHAARHGGASSDAIQSARPLPEIQARGRWEALKSVARYRKGGTYLRVLNRVPRAQRSLALSLDKSIHTGIIEAI